MAGSSVTITKTRLGDMVRLKFAWVSDDSAGTASGATGYQVVGIPQEVITVPSGGGTAPTALYDITLKGPEGIDILNGLGATRSATATEVRKLTDGLTCVICTTLTLAVTGAGNSKQGTVYFDYVDLSGVPA